MLVSISPLVVVPPMSASEAIIVTLESHVRLLAVQLAPLARRLQLPISLGLNFLLMPGKHVLRRYVADGADLDLGILLRLGGQHPEACYFPGRFEGESHDHGSVFEFAAHIHAVELGILPRRPDALA